MRVIAGRYGSRNLKAVPGDNTRPTTDKIKESLFNLLGGYFEGGICLDLYAGSGALGIEAVSRGMDKAVLCESYRAAFPVIEANIAMTKEPEKFVLLKGDNYKKLPQYMEKEGSLPFLLVVIDPPYHKQKIKQDVEWLYESGYINEQTTIVCETEKDDLLADSICGYKKVKFKNYGLTNIHIYADKEGALNG